MNFSYVIEASLILFLLNILKIFPFRFRILTGSVIFRFFISPLTGNKKRIENNLNLVLPDLPENDKKELIRNCLHHIGMTMFELLSPTDFKLAGQKANVLGPGSSLLKKAKANSQPVILVSGHFGNYDVVRANLISNGYNLGALYRPMNNPYFNKTYLKNISEIGRPLFPRGKKGMGEMMKFLRNGNLIALLIDQHMSRGEPLKCPGYIATDMVMAMPEKAIEATISQIPTGRLGEPEEIARCVVFLASKDAGFINGSTISANGAQFFV